MKNEVDLTLHRYWRFVGIVTPWRVEETLILARTRNVLEIIDEVAPVSSVIWHGMEK